MNTLSFIKLSGFQVNSFNVILEKVVGNESLTITNLIDINGLDTCKDFIRINIDLDTYSLEGGEYILTLENDGDSYSFPASVDVYEQTQTGSGVYKDVVSFNSL